MTDTTEVGQILHLIEMMTQNFRATQEILREHQNRIKVLEDIAIAAFGPKAAKTGV